MAKLPILTLALFCIKDRAWEALEILISKSETLNKFEIRITEILNIEDSV